MAHVQKKRTARRTRSARGSWFPALEFIEESDLRGRSLAAAAPQQQNQQHEQHDGWF